MVKVPMKHDNMPGHTDRYTVCMCMCVCVCGGGGGARGPRDGQYVNVIKVVPFMLLLLLQ